MIVCYEFSVTFVLFKSNVQARFGTSASITSRDSFQIKISFGHRSVLRPRLMNQLTHPAEHGVSDHFQPLIACASDHLSALFQVGRNDDGIRESKHAAMLLSQSPGDPYLVMVTRIILCATKAIDRLPGHLAALHDCPADLPPTKRPPEMNLTEFRPSTQISQMSG
jgi:hypothetical protein